MGLESCTNEVQTSMAIDISGKSVVLVDTPGFDDTTLTDTDVLKIIAAYLITMFVQTHFLPPCLADKLPAPAGTSKARAWRECFTCSVSQISKSEAQPDAT